MVDTEEQDQERCGYPGQEGPCQNPATEGSRCWIDSHTEDPEDSPGSVADGRGAPEGNDHALGNPGGGAPEGNTNAMKHGLHMTAERLLEVMDERQREEFKHRFLEYQQKTLNDSQAMAMAAAAVLRVDILKDLFDQGLERTVYTDQGDPYQQFKKDDLSALQGFFREIRLGLHYEGNSAQHQGGSSGHDNLDALVQE
ncbi:hypothetical protein HHTV1_1 [Haloarcula hispanica tailed virus 1]|uniref:Uncharacterized protein n=1 Tax=Haloarcula hispanica tailed virus 1 TaxID=1273750 RepID=R4TKQ5_9CAUD|nr:hypothetical protein M198_gp01 [Haloarcula hispanica tailed virus 1]AGM11257.1 hypothetical protein HHTV1_1 [Haloarcula hispanica tailed virus 1]